MLDQIAKTIGRQNSGMEATNFATCVLRPMSGLAKASFMQPDLAEEKK